MFRFRKSVALWLIAVAGASSHAHGQSVEELKKAGDLRGLVAKLGDRRAAVRSEAALALPGVVEKVKDPAALNPFIGRLIDVRFRDPWKITREYSGRALMAALNRTKNQVVLNNAVQPLVDALDRHQVDLERRRYAAVALSVVVMRLERVDLLRPRIAELLAATFEDPDAGVRKYAERALQHTLMKLDHEPTLTIAAHPLADKLDSKDLHFRSYSAVMLSMVVRKIKDRDTLKSLLGRITTAATKDRDKGVRDYAGRAMHHIRHVLKEEKKPAAPEKGKSGAKASNSPAAIAAPLFVVAMLGDSRSDARKSARNTKEKSVEALQKAGDVRGLVAMLSDPRGGVRRRAAFAMRQIVGDVKDPATLDPIIGRLVQVAFHDPWKSTREDCSGTLEHLLKKTENQAVLRSIIQPIFDALPHGQVDSSRRHYAATMLYLVTRKLDHVDYLMRPRIPELLSATYNDPYEHVRDYAGRALGLVLNKIDDEATLSSVAHHMVADQRLKSGDVRARRYSAEHLYNLVRKIEDHPTLRALLGRITAATKDRDERVRESASRAMRQIHNALNKKKPAEPANSKATT